MAIPACCPGTKAWKQLIFQQDLTRLPSYPLSFLNVCPPVANLYHAGTALAGGQILTAGAACWALPPPRTLSARRWRAPIQPWWI